MEIPEILGLLLLLAGAWYMWSTLKAREAAVGASRAACRAEGFLFLDDTVAIDSVRPMRDSDGRLRLRRVYRFEYSDTGDNRRRGAVTLIGDAVVALYIGPRPVRDGEGSY